MKNRPELGTWHLITSVARKRRDIINTRTYDFKTRVQWTRGLSLKPVKGMYIGFRHVMNGILTESGSDVDYSRYFTRETSQEVWVFVLSPRKNPVYVFPDDVTEIKEDGT